MAPAPVHRTRAQLKALKTSHPSIVASVQDLVERFDSQHPLPADVIAELTLRLHMLLSEAEATLLAAEAPAVPLGVDVSPQDLRDSLEKFALTRLYPAVFAAGEGDSTADAELRQHLLRLQSTMTPAALGVAAPGCHRACKMNPSRSPLL